MEGLLKHINTISPLSKISWKALKQILVDRNYPIGTHLSSLNETPTRVFFLKSGYARGYTLSRKGNQYNRVLYKPNEFMASLSALIQKSKTYLAIECLTDCQTSECNFNKFIELTDTFPDIDAFYQKILEENFVRFELRNIQLVTMTATERYVDLRKRIPKIDDIISQKHIASHIGVSPIQLSRIRRKLFS